MALLSGLDDPDGVTVRVAQREHQRDAGHAHRLRVDVHAELGEPLVLGERVTCLDTDGASARAATHRRGERGAGGPGGGAPTPRVSPPPPQRPWPGPPAPRLSL